MDYDALVEQVAAPTPPIPDTAKADPETAPVAAIPAALPDDTAAPAPQTPDHFGDLVESVTDDRIAQAQAANAAMQGTSADKAAKAIELSKQLNIPAQAILPNLDSYAAQAELQKNNKLIADNPALAAWVNDQPAAANAAKDDFDKLDTLSKIAVTLADMNVPVMENQLGRAGANLAGENAIGANTDETQQRIQALKGELGAYSAYQPTGVYGKVSWGLNQAMGLVDNVLNALPEVGGGAVAGAAAGLPEAGIGALPGGAIGAGTGLKVGLAADWAKVAAGQTYLQLSDIRDKNGQPMTEGAKQIATGTVGALTFGIGLIGGPAQGAVATDALHALTGDAVKQALARPTVVAALTTIAKDTAIGAGQGAAMMGSMAAAQQLGVEMGKQISPGDWNTVINDPKTRAEYVGQLADAIENGAITFGALHGVGGAIGEYGNYKSSEAMQQQFGSLLDNSADSKTRARSPDAFQTFMQSQLNNTGAENVYVPADKIRALYDRAGVTPGADDGILGKAAPDIADQLAQSAPVSGDVVIPAADYATHIAGTPMDKALRPDLRVTQDGMSLNEMEEFKNKYQDIISKLGDTIQAQQESPTNKIYQDMQDKAVKAGFTDPQASQYAAVVASRYATRGERLGVDPLELYHQQGIQIRQGEPGEAPDAALQAFPAKPVANEVTLDDLEKNSRDQIVGENRPISELLDFLKGEKELPRDKKQMTLTGFLKKNGGIKDEGGELAAMDANKAVKGLVRKTGMTHDDAALKAWEAGYIGKPEGARPSIDELREAIRRDLQKRDVFSGNEDLLDKGKHAQADDLNRILDQHEIPYEGRETPEILKDMRDAGLLPEESHDRGEPEEFNQSANPAAITQTPEFKSWFGESKVVDDTGAPKVMYRGDYRGDKLPASFKVMDENEGGSGGIYFTDDPEIASSYAKNKSYSDDAHDNVIDNTEVVLNGKKMPLARAGAYLTKAQKDKIEAAVLSVGEHDDYNGIGSEDPFIGKQTWADYLKRNAGNYVKAADDVLIKAGTLGIEDYLRFWKETGIFTHFLFDDPTEARSTVTPVYLSIKNPLDIGNITPEQMAELRKASGESDITASSLHAAIENGDHRTVSFVTPEFRAALEKLGYDGIKDEGGKITGGEDHTVYIALNPEQIKSVHNEGGFDATNANILKQDERAKVTIAEGQHIITLFQGADKSAVLHELGHVWLTELQADAEADGAPEQLKKDWNTIKDYIGHTEGAIAEEGHETFARSFEQYLMEGKAPSQSLRRAFQRFKQWLTAIYRSVKNLNVPMNNDVRGVFDRMLATDDEITQMETRQQVNQLFKTKEQAGMTDKEFADYNNRAINAQQAAREELLTQAMEEVRAKIGKEWNKAAGEIKPSIADAIKQRQDIRMLDWFKTGKLRDAAGNEVNMEPLPIDKASLEGIAPGAEKDMPRAVKVTEDGAHPDDIAPLLGYNTGADMINDLRELGKTEKNAGRQQVANYLTDQVVNSRLQEKFGVTDDQLQARAEELMGSPDRLDMKLAELRALSRKTGQHVMFTKENIGAWADDHIANMKAADAANSYQFVRAAAKAGRDATRLLAKGDDKATMEALQRQALNMALADRAKGVESDYASGNKLFKYAASKPTIKSTDQGYLNQVHALLSQLGFRVRRDARELQNSLAGQSLKDFVTDKVNIGRDVFAPDSMFDKPLPAYKDMTVAMFNDLHDMVQSLLHNGRDEQSITVEGKRVEKDRIITDILNNLQSFKEKPKSEFLNPADAGFLRRNLDKFTSMLRAADSELLKPEQFLDWLDKRNVMGPLNKYVFRPMKDAQVRENDLLAEQSKSFRDLDVPDDWHKTLDKEVFNDTLIDPDTGNPARLSRKTMLTIALNTGNASNLKKLADGYKWNAADVQDFLQKNMTKADWDFTQHSWDSFEKLWPQIEEMQRRMTGVAPPKIDATAIKTPHGEYRGGYYPVVYDPNKTRVGERASAQEAIFDHDYYRPTTSQGHTIARVNFTDKILLNLDVMPWKLKQAIHDLAFREAIVNADKILSDNRFKDALKSTWGPEYGKEFRPWLRDIANQPNADNRPMSFIDNALRYSRMTMVEMGIGFRLTTMAKHGLTALSNSVGEIGPDAMRRGVQEYYSARDEKRAFVMERSGEMRHRMTQYDRDIRENMSGLMGEKSILTTMRHFGHYGVAFFDMESALPTWIGAYRKALADGMEDKDAVYAADKTVRNAHGAQGQVDLAGVQRGPEYKKLFTMFYGFFNHMYNRERDITRRMQENPDGLDMAKILGKTLAYIAIPAMVEQAISGNSNKNDSWGKWASKAIANQMASTIPLVRDVSGYLEHGQAAETPMSRTIRALGDQAKDIGNAVEGNQVSKKWLKHAIETPGYILGAPTGQAATSAQYLWDVSDGKENPKDVKEWMHGLMYGKSEEK